MRNKEIKRWKRRKTNADDTRLPRPGESSFNLVLKGLNAHQHTLNYGRRKGKGRHGKQFTTTFHPEVACVRRYYLIRGNLAPESIPWSYPPGIVITRESKHFYTVFDGRKPFASFVDAGEAMCFAFVLKKFFKSDTKILRYSR